MLNITHLRYALEVAKTLSITKAAENLYMGQPNLSRSIRELEEKLGIEIFKRTSKGISVTEQGEEFLMYAKTIMEQISLVESIYQKDHHADMQFSISVPRASYISCAFEDFMAKHVFSHVEWHMKGYRIRMGKELPKAYIAAKKEELKTIYPLPNAFGRYTKLIK